jgi:hypothetical protein
MVVVPNRERLECPLPEVATRSVMKAIAPRVSRKQPLHPTTQIPGAPRADHNVKVNGHQAVSQDIQPSYREMTLPPPPCRAGGHGARRLSRISETRLLSPPSPEIYVRSSRALAQFSVATYRPKQNRRGKPRQHQTRSPNEWAEALGPYNGSNSRAERLDCLSLIPLQCRKRRTP